MGRRPVYKYNPDPSLLAKKEALENLVELLERDRDNLAEICRSQEQTIREQGAMIEALDRENEKMAGLLERRRRRGRCQVDA